MFVRRRACFPLTNEHSHTDVEVHHTVGKDAEKKASTDQEGPSNGGQPGPILGTGHRGNGRCKGQQAHENVSSLTPVMKMADSELPLCRIK